MLLKCLDKLGKQISSFDRQKMTDSYQAFIDKGLSEDEASLSALTEYHRDLFNDANELRAAAGLKTVDYQALDLSAIEKNYNEAKAEIEAKRAETPKTSLEKNAVKTLETVDKITEKSAAEIEQIPAVPITDFGEKIGGARKDKAESGFQMSGKKPRSEQPAWMKGFEIGQREDGRFQPFSANERGFIQWRSRETFETAEEALTAIKLFQVLSKFRTRKAENGYEIYRRVGDRKFHTVKDGFATEEEAKTHLLENLDEFLNYKPTFPERPHLENLERTGKDHRNGQNVTPEIFSNQFGFTGVEFGNWIPQDERQRLLNMAFDGLMDLADILQIPPRAVSLNGQLSIAFGSRGQGLSKAAAHYERNRAVFNLTRMKGAGSVAHEWFHAVDHYFGAQDKGATLAKNEKGIVESVKGRESDFLSQARMYETKARQAMIDAFRKVIETIFKQPKIVEVSVTRYETQVEKYTTDLEYANGRLRQHLQTEKRYTRKKSPATAEQMQKFDDLLKQIADGNLGEAITLPTKSQWKTIATFEVFRDLNNLVTEITGRSELRNNPQGYGQTGMVYEIQKDFKALETAKAELAKYQIDNKIERTTPTKFYYDAKDIDRMRSGDYWSTNHEMAARAFEAFVEDQLKARGDKSQYLVHSTENSIYAILFGLNPYPKGIERERINQAFNDFFNVLETEESENGNVSLKAASWNSIANAELGELIAPMQSALESDDSYRLALNPESAEYLRRVFQEVKGQKELPFHGLFQVLQDPNSNRETTAKAVALIQNQAKQAKKLGYSPQEIANLQSLAGNILQAAKNGNGAFIFIVDNAYLNEEEFHRAGFVAFNGMVLQARHAYFDKLKSTKAVQNYKRVFADYLDESSPEMRDAIAVEETAAVFARGGWAEIGVSKDEAIEYLALFFESEAEKLKQLNINPVTALKAYNSVTEGVVRETLKQTIESGGRAGQAEKRNSGIGQQSGEAAGEDQGTSGQDGGGKNTLGNPVVRRNGIASLPETLRDAGYQAERKSYEVQSNSDLKRAASEMADKENSEFTLMRMLRDEKAAPSPEETAFALEMVKRLSREVENESNQEIKEAKLEKIAEIVDLLDEKLRQAGRTIQAVNLLEPLSPDAIVATAQRRKKRFDENGVLSPEEAADLQEKAKELEFANEELKKLKAKYKRLEKKFEEKDEKQRRSRKQRETLKPSFAVQSVIKKLELKEGDILSTFRAKFNQIGDLGLKAVNREKDKNWQFNENELNLFDSQGNINYDELENISDGIERGDIAVTRLNEAEERGRIEGGRRNVEASVIAGTKDSPSGRAGTGSRYLSWEEHKQNVKDQEEALEKYAKDQGIWIDYETLHNEYGFYRPGTESDVFFDKDDENYLIKANAYDFAQRQTPLEFIDRRIAAHNHLFPDTKYELVGFTRDRGGNFRFLLRQHFITKEGTVSRSELKKHLADNYGLSQTGLNEFSNDRYVISDLHEENRIKSSDGMIHFIDPIINFNPENVEIPSFGLKDAKKQADNQGLKAANLSQTLTDEEFDQLTDFGALEYARGFRKLPSSHFKLRLETLFGEGIRPFADEIFAKSKIKYREMLKEARIERQIENLRAIEGNENLSRPELEKLLEKKRLELAEAQRISREHLNEANQILGIEPDSKGSKAGPGITTAERELINDDSLSKEQKILALLFMSENRPMLKDLRLFALNELNLDNAAAEKAIDEAIAAVDWIKRKIKIKSLENRGLTEEEAKTLNQKKADILRSYQDSLGKLKQKPEAEKRPPANLPKLNDVQRRVIDEADRRNISKNLRNAALMLANEPTPHYNEISKTLRRLDPALDAKAADRLVIEAVGLLRDLRKAISEEKKTKRAEKQKTTAQQQVDIDKAIKRRREAFISIQAKLRQIGQKPPTYLGRTRRIFKGFLVSAWKTAVNNAISGAGTVAVQTVVDVVDLAYRKILAKNGVKLGEGLDSNLKFRDVVAANSFRILRSRRLAEGILDNFPFQHEKLFGRYNADIESSVATDEKTTKDKLLNPVYTGVEKFVEFINIPNQIQEFSVRSVEFMRAISAIAKEKGSTIETLWESRKIDSFFTEEDLERAVNQALTATFALKPDPNTLVGKAVSSYNEIMNQSVLAVFAPLEPAVFATFMWNAGKFITDYNPILHIPKNLVLVSAGKKEYSTKDAAKLTTGMFLLGLALLGVRAFGSGDDRWYVWKIGGVVIDLRGYQPFASFIYAAEVLNRIYEGRIPVEKGVDFFEQFTGTSVRGIVDNPLLEALVLLSDGMSGKDEKWVEREKQLGGKTLANVISSPFNFLKIFKDIVAYFDENEATEYDYSESPVMSQIHKKVPFSSYMWQYAPRRDFVTGTIKKRKHPELGLLGITAYGETYRQQTAAEELALSMREPKRRESEILPEEQRRSDAIRDISKAIERGENADSAIDRAVGMNLIKEKFGEILKRNQGKIPLQILVERLQLTPEEKKRLLPKTTNEERSILEGIIQKAEDKKIETENKKIVNQAKDEKKEARKTAIQNLINQGKNGQNINSKINEAIKNKEIDSIDRNKILKGIKESPIQFAINTATDADKAIEAFNSASENEKIFLIKVLRAKRNRARSDESKEKYDNVIKQYSARIPTVKR